MLANRAVNLFNRYGKIGLTFPPRLLPSYKPDPELTQLPYRYFHLDKDYVPILNEPGGAESGQSYFPGFVYVSYVDRVDTGRGIYYMLPAGGWIPGKGARVGEDSAFQGLQFSSTPSNAFAWQLPFYTDSVPVRNKTGYNTPLTDKILYPYVDIVQIYDTKNVDGIDWNLIGPNQWVEARILAVVKPNPSPPDGVTNGRLDRC